MKRFIWLVALFALGGCKSTPTEADISDNYIQYSMGGNQYSVVYIETESTSSSTAHQRARAKAAQITTDNGYRYFIVDSEKNVMVAHTPSSGANSGFHQNLYQELIVEGNFGPNSDSAKGMDQPTPQMYPGVRITFRCFKENPGKNAVDACGLTGCD